ncbi:C39 family peptidase [Micromonospora sp. HK10]|uniref:C39 family peptidase n=1 Tax=Micromonospora sp. HK10 TaxID=1538294 RepID=UPI0018CF1774|nr:C39 family peptidase [Micromonospora sp. HK10]
MEETLKHHVKRQLRRLATERPYQIIAGSAAALVLAGGTAALATTDDAPARQEHRAAVAELESRLDDVATRGEARVAIPSPSTSPSTSPSPSARAKSAAPADPDLTTRAAKPKPPSTKILKYRYQAQTTYWNCGPAAVRNALSASGVETTQEALAGPLGTTEGGTNSAEDTTRGLNQMVKGNPYRTHMFGGAASPAEMDQLQADVVKAVTDGRGVVVNVAGDAVDTDGGWHSFPGGHYVAVIGYRNDGRTVRIADSANPALPEYWLSTIDLANWAASRGYSA